MVFTFQISLTKWFETDSVGLLKICVMPRIMQLLCSRDQEAVQKGRDSNGISYDDKGCPGRILGALHHPFRA